MGRGSLTGLIRRSGIRSLLFLLLLVVLVPMVLVQAGISYRSYRERRAAALRDDLALARSFRASFELYLREVRRDEGAIGRDLSQVTPSPSPARASAVLAEAVQQYPSLRSLSWANAEGVVVASSNPALIGRNRSGESWYGRILHGSDWAVSDLMHERGPLRGTFRIAQGIRDRQGALQGVLLAVVAPEQLEERMNLPPVQGKTISLVDSNAWLVYRYPRAVLSWEQRNLRARYPSLLRALRGEEVVGSGVDREDKQRHLFVFTPIRSVGWAVMASEREAAVTGPITRDMVGTLGTLGLVALIALIIAILLARRLTDPVERLSAHALAVARGDPPQRVRVEGPRELANLAAMFDRMANEVQLREQEHAQLLAVERERAQDAQLLEAILDHSVAMVAYFDRDLRYVRVNDIYCQTFELSREELVGRRFAEVNESAPVLRLLESVRDTGEAVELHEAFRPPTARPSLGPTYWDVSVVPIRGGTGAVEGLVLSAVNITQQVQAREDRLEVERSRAQLAEVVAAETDHRMKNNLMLISGMLQLQLNAEAHDSHTVSALRDAAARIQALGLIHEQMYKAQPGWVELTDALRRLAEAAAAIRPAGDVDLLVEGAPVSVPSKIGTAVAMLANELLTNAIKHGGPDTDGRLRIRVYLAPCEGKLALRIWNSGPPVPADFDPAKQQGLGMHLVALVVESQLGGEFSLRPWQGGTLAEVLMDKTVLG